MKLGDLYLGFFDCQFSGKIKIPIVLDRYWVNGYNCNCLIGSSIT